MTRFNANHDWRTERLQRRQFYGSSSCVSNSSTSKSISKHWKTQKEEKRKLLCVLSHLEVPIINISLEVFLYSIHFCFPFLTTGQSFRLELTKLTNELTLFTVSKVVVVVVVVVEALCVKPIGASHLFVFVGSVNAPKAIAV